MDMSLKILQGHPLVRTIFDTFSSYQNAEVFVVGGAVRDALLKRPIQDIDFVVSRVPLEKLEHILQKVGKVSTVGKRFAVLKLTLPDGTTTDIALPRSDASFGTGRYRDVKVRADPNLSIQHDVARRDFTINAMAWDIKTNTLIDPHGGRADLRIRSVRCVGDPTERFQEDATRILRAVRFATELGFDIEQSTSRAIKQKLTLLTDENITPREVIAKDLVRAFTAAPARALDLLDELGIIQTLTPELSAMHGCEQPEKYHAEGDVWTHTRIALEALHDPRFRKQFGVEPSPQLVITALLHDIGKPLTQKTPERDGADRIRFDNHAPLGAEVAQKICNRLKLESTGAIDCELLGWLIEHHLDTLNLDTMKLATIEKTFMIPSQRGVLLQQLCWVDARASLDPEEVRRGKKFHEPQKFEHLQERIKEIVARGYRQKKPMPLLDGNEIMRLLKIGSGPKVGEYLEILRNAQLNGEVKTRDDATALLRTIHGTRNRH